MSSTLLLAPHSDDETLFCCWTLLREHPDVVICLQDPEDAKGRSIETQMAMDTLRHKGNLIFWDHKEQATDPSDLLNSLAEIRQYYEWCYAPQPEPGGHEEHNAVGFAAKKLFGENITYYKTYTRSTGRSRGSVEVEYEPLWLARKLRALACYVSQHDHPHRRYWFEQPDLREWYA
jgi:LmbE family N-acetylglucosaminyl deacetylase